MSLVEAKRLLAEAIGKYDQLKLQLADKNNLDAYSDEQWHAHLKHLGLEAAQLIKTSRLLDNDNLICMLNRKQRKLKRHRIWKKKHRKRVQQQKKQLTKRNEKWIRDTQWKVTMSPSVNAAAAVATVEANKQKDTTEKDVRSTIKTLSKKLALLTEIRSLRRKKLEAKGHFFADEGNQFFNKIKEWHDANKKQTPPSDEIPSETEKRELQIHTEDSWQNIPIDKVAYNYWCEADQSLDALLNVRRLWDQYIRRDAPDSDYLHKVPPTFVTPPPPANYIWASYLL